MLAVPGLALAQAPSMGPAPSMGAAPSASMALEPLPAAPVHRAPAVRGVPTPAPAWLDATTVAGRVTVRSPAAMSRLAQRLASVADRALARAAGDLEGLPAPDHIEVRLVDQASDLLRVAPSGRGAPSYAVGVAYPDLGVVTIAQRRQHEVLDAEATLRHELAHIALGVALGPSVPRWLHEGFAYQHSAEWSMERTETLAGMVWFDSIIPLDRLDSSFPAEELATHRAYVQSYDFVGFLSRRGRWAEPDDDGDRFPFRRFLAAIASGRTIDQAAVYSYGRPLSSLFTEWRDDLTNRFMMMPVGLFMFGVWVLATLLLVLGWRRRRRQARATMARWDTEDRGRWDTEARGAPSPSFAELAADAAAYEQAAAAHEQAAAATHDPTDAAAHDRATTETTAAPSVIIEVRHGPIAPPPSPQPAPPEADAAVRRRAPSYN